MRLFAFIVALLLLGGSIDPTRGWLIALVVVTGIAALRPGFWSPWRLRPRIDLRLASFVIAVLLLAGTVEPTRDWLIGLTVATGLAMVAPRMFSIDLFGAGDDRVWCGWGGWGRHEWRSKARHDSWSTRDDDGWSRWERRMDRRSRRGFDRTEDWR
jgi:hypothetical protein